MKRKINEIILPPRMITNITIIVVMIGTVFGLTVTTNSAQVVPTITEIPLITNDALQMCPSIYSDRVVWADDRNGDWDIYLYDLSTATETQITNNPAGQINPSIYNDRIVWQDSRHGNTDIYLYDLSTETETQITTNTATRFYPVIYGDRIVWQDDREGNMDIYLYDLATETETQITTALTHDEYPAIYGDLIVWTGERNGNTDIYLYDLATKTETQITDDDAWQYGPAIYGDRIVWQDDRLGDWHFYLYDLSTKTESPIITAPTAQGKPVKPVMYCERIVWADTRHNNYDIFLYDLSTTTEIQITTNPADQVEAAIYGDQIVWRDHRNEENWDIYLAELCYGPNTPPGVDVEVPLDSTVTITFSEVTSAGTTTFTMTNAEPPPPTGFHLVPSGMYYDITTTATFTGTILICINYDDSNLSEEEENELELIQYDVTTCTWDIITTSLCPVNNFICGVTDHLSFFGVMYPQILATIDVTPDTLNIKNQGNWITAYIELPVDYDINEIDPGTIKLTFETNDVPIDLEAPITIGDYDNDGVPDLMVKFDRTVIVNFLGINDQASETGNGELMEFTIMGTIAGATFVGSDWIRVIQPGK